MSLENMRRPECGAAAQDRRGCALLLMMPHAVRQKNPISFSSWQMIYLDLGCYGQRHIQTPHIDRLADEGLRFTQCYAGASVCAPSRQAFEYLSHEK